jgi:hypothetical protein
VLSALWPLLLLPLVRIPPPRYRRLGNDTTVSVRATLLATAAVDTIWCPAVAEATVPVRATLIATAGIPTAKGGNRTEGPASGAILSCDEPCKGKG